MNHPVDINTCNRRDDLISVLYGEASDHESAEFHVHMQTCTPCQAEMRAFGEVRESIGSWKFEALSGADVMEVNVRSQTPRTKSAVAALREFFDLSPLWLKGATAFATVLFCLLVVLALVRFQQPSQVVEVNNKPNAVYTKQEKDQLVQKALDEQKAEFLARTTAPTPKEIIVKVSHPQMTTTRPNTIAKGRRPLTKWEREQLAADLRLLQRHDDDIELLSEPINR